jgi:hypothetical protein
MTDGCYSEVFAAFMRRRGRAPFFELVQWSSWYYLYLPLHTIRDIDGADASFRMTPIGST